MNQQPTPPTPATEFEAPLRDLIVSKEIITRQSEDGKYTCHQKDGIEAYATYHKCGFCSFVLKPSHFASRLKEITTNESATNTTD